MQLGCIEEADSLRPIRDCRIGRLDRERGAHEARRIRPMIQETGSKSAIRAQQFDDSAIRSVLVIIETAYLLEALDPGFAAALHDSMGLNLTVLSKRSRQVLRMRDQPYLRTR
jgi:hypothetical protein